DDAHRRERLLERVELRPKRALDALPGLVAPPEVVAEGLDDVVRRDAEVRRAPLDHLRDRVEHARDRAHRPILPLRGAPGAVEVAEELVGPVEEMDDHRREKRDPWGFALGMRPRITSG